ncbi:hypothetical protein [Streptomyces sp. 150FB]|uniref:hypothetical protein n=1 Tax=Streptomyces sp. 150FB TaxID=1576605 RepID=UPI001364DB0A|nr:hypothetical protein [Streptomyces sp. 150FB]
MVQFHFVREASQVIPKLRDRHENGMPAAASQPVNCWRKVSFSAATYSTCS